MSKKMIVFVFGLLVSSSVYSMEEASLSILPKEVLQKILRDLEIEDFSAVSCVNTTLYGFSRLPDEVMCSEARSSYFDKWLKFLPNLTELYISSNTSFDQHLLKSCPNLEVRRD